jgi:hypothetical protein
MMKQNRHRNHSKKGGTRYRPQPASRRPAERKHEMNLAQFKTFKAEQMDLDELVALTAFGRSLRSEYEALQLEEPAFVDVQLKSLRREITARNADKLSATKRELEARIDSLKSPAQKKKELEEKLAKIKEQELAHV